AHQARDDVAPELLEDPEVVELLHDLGRRRPELAVGGAPPELPDDDDRDRDDDLRRDLDRLVAAAPHTASTRCEGCHRRARRSTVVNRRCVPFPSPGVPMNSSAVNARISATADAMRIPVAM